MNVSVADDQLSTSQAPIAARRTTPHRARIGVNAIGGWAATTGLAEAGRRAVAAMVTAGIGVSLVDVDVHAPTDPSRLPPALAQLPRGRRYPVDFCALNVNELQLLDDAFLRPPGRQQYVIGSWYWELPTMPSHIAKQVPRVDEVWVASRFVADAMRGYTSAPVHIVPAVVEPLPDPSCTRRSFGLPESACLYLFSFDANSTFARKNPLGVVRAFLSAFSRTERSGPVGLVMKTLNLSKLPEARAALVSELEPVNGILIDDELTAGEMSALISLCDVYVSLHRAEGFGLGLAEAMYQGKPVVATAYSGNVDFMDALNSCPVPYQLEAVRMADLRFNPYMERVYVPGSLWAAPDMTAAARLMRLLFERPALRARIGDRASATIRERYGSVAAGSVMRRRLGAIGARR